MITVSIPIAAAAIIGLIILLIRNAILNRRIERYKFMEDMFKMSYVMEDNETEDLENKIKELKKQLKIVKNNKELERHLKDS